jgi:hypothetical protein
MIEYGGLSIKITEEHSDLTPKTRPRAIMSAYIWKACCKSLNLDNHIRIELAGLNQPVSGIRSLATYLLYFT